MKIKTFLHLKGDWAPHYSVCFKIKKKCFRNYFFNSWKTILKLFLALKQLIESKASEAEDWPDFPVANQRLIFQGQLLQNDSQLISSIVNLEDNSVLHINFRQPNQQGTIFQKNFFYMNQ